MNSVRVWGWFIFIYLVQGKIWMPRDADKPDEISVTLNKWSYVMQRFFWSMENLRWSSCNWVPRPHRYQFEYGSGLSQLIRRVDINSCNTKSQDPTWSWLGIRWNSYQYAAQLRTADVYGTGIWAARKRFSGQIPRTGSWDLHCSAIEGGPAFFFILATWLYIFKKNSLFAILLSTFWAISPSISINR